MILDPYLRDEWESIIREIGVIQYRCGCAWIGNHQVLTCPDCHVQLELPFDAV